MVQIQKSTLLALLVHSATCSASVATETNQAAVYHIELAPGESRWVREEEKWQLRRDGHRFFDITDNHDLGSIHAAGPTRLSVFPKLTHQTAIHPLQTNLSTTPMHDNLETLTAFHTRFYLSDTGRQASEWLLARIRETISAAGPTVAARVRADPFPHIWGQPSIIVTIPGRSASTVVVGAHLDSINQWFPPLLAAPGADDDGSGCVTILEALRVLLLDPAVARGEAHNTLEFHWYAAEEAGLLGSQAIFGSYEKARRDVRAMLHQDMTGYVAKTLEAGEPESVGVITDYVDEKLTDFMRDVIREYCDIPFVETKCGYACSDHASATKAGYPSAFVMEAAFKYTDDHIHTANDVMDNLSFDHMLQHAKMTLAFAYELAFTDFAKLDQHQVAASPDGTEL